VAIGRRERRLATAYGREESAATASRAASLTTATVSNRARPARSGNAPRAGAPTTPSARAAAALTSGDASRSAVRSAGMAQFSPRATEPSAVAADARIWLFGSRATIRWSLPVALVARGPSSVTARTATRRTSSHRSESASTNARSASGWLAARSTSAVAAWTRRIGLEPLTTSSHSWSDLPRRCGLLRSHPDKATRTASSAAARPGAVPAVIRRSPPAECARHEGH